MRGRTCSRQNSASSRRIGARHVEELNVHCAIEKLSAAAARSGIALNMMGHVASQIASS